MFICELFDAPKFDGNEDFIDLVCNSNIINKLINRNALSDYEEILSKGNSMTGPAVFRNVRNDGRIVITLFAKRGIKPTNEQQCGELLTPFISKVAETHQLNLNKVYSTTFSNHAHLYMC